MEHSYPFPTSKSSSSSPQSPTFLEYSPLAHLYAANATTIHKSSLHISDENIIQRSVDIQNTFPSDAFHSIHNNSLTDRDNDDSEVRSFIVNNNNSLLISAPVYQYTPFQTSSPFFSNNDLLDISVASFNKQDAFSSVSTSLSMPKPLSPLERPSLIKQSSSLEGFSDENNDSSFDQTNGFISAPLSAFDANKSNTNNNHNMTESSLYTQLNGLCVSTTKPEPIAPAVLPSPPSYIESYSSFICCCPLTLLLQVLISILTSLNIDWQWKSKGSFRCIYYENNSCESVAFKIKFYQWSFNNAIENAMNNMNHILMEFQRRFGSCLPFNKMIRLVQNKLIQREITLQVHAQFINNKNNNNNQLDYDQMKKSEDLGLNNCYNQDNNNYSSSRSRSPSRSRSHCRSRSRSPLRQTEGEGMNDAHSRDQHRSNRRSDSRERLAEQIEGRLYKNKEGERSPIEIEGASKLTPLPPIRSSLAPLSLQSSRSTSDYSNNGNNKNSTSQLDISTLQILLTMSDLRHNGDVRSSLALLASFASLPSNAELMIQSFSEPIRRLVIDSLSCGDADTARCGAQLLTNICKIPQLGIGFVSEELMDSVLKSLADNNNNNNNNTNNQINNELSIIPPINALYEREIHRQLAEALSLLALSNASAILSICSASAFRYASLRAALTKWDGSDDQKLDAAVKSAARALKI